MRRGPAASPSSQMVTSRTEADLREAGGVDGSEEGGVRERTMEGARGTREIQLNVLWLLDWGFMKYDDNVQMRANACMGCIQMG